MKILHEHSLCLRITEQDGQKGCDITTAQGALLYGTAAEYAHENDAIYAALHGLALANNFSGCLKEARVPS